jgi:hypothetical protein
MPWGPRELRTVAAIIIAAWTLFFRAWSPLVWEVSSLSSWTG